MRTRYAVAAALIVALAVLTAAFWRHGRHGDAGIQHWLAIHTGTDDESGPYYGFLSGAGSDITELALLAGLFTYYRKHNCHAKSCWRIARHPVEGTSYTVCRRHHPDGKPTAADIQRAHDDWRMRLHLYAGQRPGDG